MIPMQEDNDINRKKIGIKLYYYQREYSQIWTELTFYKKNILIRKGGLKSSNANPPLAHLFTICPIPKLLTISYTLTNLPIALFLEYTRAEFLFIHFKLSSMPHYQLILLFIHLLVLVQLKVAIFCTLNATCSSGYGYSYSYQAYHHFQCSPKPCLPNIYEIFTIQQCTQDWKNRNCTPGYCLYQYSSSICLDKNNSCGEESVDSILCGNCTRVKCRNNLCLQIDGGQFCHSGGMCTYESMRVEHKNCADNKDFNGNECMCCGIEDSFEGEVGICVSESGYDEGILLGYIDGLQGRVIQNQSRALYYEYKSNPKNWENIVCSNMVLLMAVWMVV